MCSISVSKNVFKTNELYSKKDHYHDYCISCIIASVNKDGGLSQVQRVNEFVVFPQIKLK